MAINRLSPILSSPWTPSELGAPLVTWFDAADTTSIISSSGTVSQWNDKSGNNNHGTQTSPTNRPETGVTTLNGLNTIAVRNSNKYLNVPNAPTSLAFYAVVDLLSTGAGTIITLGADSSTTNELFFRTSTNIDISFDGVAGSGEGKFSLNGSSYSGFSANHTTSSAPNSGGHIIAGVFNSSFALSTFLNRPGLSSDPDGHRAGEIISTSTDLADNDKQKIEGYLAHKWGLTSNLPGSHPYKTTPP